MELTECIDGILLGDCENAKVLTVGSVQNILAHIPVKHYKSYKKLFNQVGGVEYVIKLGCYLLNKIEHYSMPSLNQGDHSDRSKEIISLWLPAEKELKDIGLQAFNFSAFANLEGYPASLSDLFDISNLFGYTHNGYINIRDLVYIRCKQKFMSVHDINILYAPSTIKKEGIPVCVDEQGGLWKDASDYGMENRFADSVISDPLLPSGLNTGYVNSYGELVKVSGHAVFNLFTPPRIKEGRYDPAEPTKFVAPFINHVKNLMPHDKDYALMIDWCKHIIQCTGEKCRWAPLLYSIDQGVGKDTIINMIEGIIGKRYCSTIKASDLSDSFNEWAQSVIIRISEVSEVSERQSRKKFQEEVKTIISGDDEFVTVNPKYGIKFSVRNIAHVILTTNNPQDIAVSDEDRRYDVIKCATKDEMGITDPNVYTDYFCNLYDWYRNGGREDLYAYLKNDPISSEFNVTKPRLTTAKEELQENTKSIYDWCYEVIDFIKGQQTYSDELVRADTFVAVAKMFAERRLAWAGPEKNKIAKTVAYALPKIGYMQVRKLNNAGKLTNRITVGHGKYTSVYIQKLSSLDTEKADFNYLLSPEKAESIVMRATDYSHIIPANGQWSA